MRVADIMTTDVVVAERDTPVSEVARRMIERGVSTLPVVEDGKVIGIVSESDLIVQEAELRFPRYLKLLDSVVFLESTREYEEELRRVLASTAGELMTTPVHTITPDADITTAATRMVERKVNALPVVENGRLVGIISRTDIIRFLVEAARATGSATP